MSPADPMGPPDPLTPLNRPASASAAGPAQPPPPPQAPAAGALPLPPGWAWQPADAVAPEPWRNGGGSTRTLLTWPAGSGPAAPWRLRISLADITQDGPFSAFAGVQRWFAVVQGGGVRLRPPAAGAPGQAALCLRPDSLPHHFDGGQPPDCQLLDGPTRDLNLMLRDLDGGLHAARPGQPWCAPAGAWRAALVDGPAELQCGPHRLRLPGLGLLHAGLPAEPSATPAASATARPPAAAPWRLQMGLHTGLQADLPPGQPAARAWWLWARLPLSIPACP